MDPFRPPFTSLNQHLGDGGPSSFVSPMVNHGVMIRSAEPNPNYFQRDMMCTPQPPQNGYEPLYHAQASGNPVQYSGALNVWPRGMQQVSSWSPHQQLTYGDMYGRPDAFQNLVTSPCYTAHEMKLTKPDMATIIAPVRPQPPLAYNHCPTAGRNKTGLSSNTASCNLQSQTFMCNSKPDELKMSKPDALPWSSYMGENGQTHTVRSHQELAYSPSATNWQPNKLKLSKQEGLPWYVKEQENGERHSEPSFQEIRFYPTTPNCQPNELNIFEQKALPCYSHDEEKTESTAMLCQVRSQLRPQSHAARPTHSGMLASLEDLSCEPVVRSKSKIMAKTLSNGKKLFLDPPSMPRSSRDSSPKLTSKNLVDQKKSARSRRVSAIGQDSEDEEDVEDAGNPDLPAKLKTSEKPSLVGKPVKKENGKMEKICSQIEAYFSEEMAEDEKPECGSARSGPNKSTKGCGNKYAQRNKKEQQGQKTVSVKCAPRGSSTKRVKKSTTKKNPKDGFDSDSNEESCDDGKTMGGPTFYMPKRRKKGKGV